MKIIDFDINNVPNNDKDLVLCLGFYDGLHLGHQKLINKALAGATSNVITPVG